MGWVEGRGCMFLKKGGISRRGMKEERRGWYTFPHYDLKKLSSWWRCFLNEQWEASKYETSCKELNHQKSKLIYILQIESKRLVKESTNHMKTIELLSVGNQNKTTEKNNINDKSSNHLQSECQYQT